MFPIKEKGLKSEVDNNLIVLQTNNIELKEVNIHRLP